MTPKQIADINNIYDQYHNTLLPLMQNYEVILGEHPIEILNEIHSIFSHFSRCYSPNASATEIDENIQKAQNHMKRAILDGFKYMCYAYQIKIDEFKKEYSRVFALIDNGTFIDEFYEKLDLAQKSFLKAKQAETSSKDVSVSYPLYEMAYNAYDDIYHFALDKKKDSGKLKAITDKDYKKKFLISLAFNIGMGILAVGSFIFGLIAIL